MSFGLSGQINENVMVGGDVVVAWIDHETLSGYAYDYYLDAKSQCAGGHGSCPDVKLSVRANSTGFFLNRTIDMCAHAISITRERILYSRWHTG